MTAKRKVESQLPVKYEKTALVLPPGLLNDLRGLINEARQNVAREMDSTLVVLHWNVGRRIHKDILGETRAEYGEGIVSALGRQLSAEFGRGFDEKSLRHMIRYAEAFPDGMIVSALLRQLSWSHFVTLIHIDDSLKRKERLGLRLGMLNTAMSFDDSHAASRGMVRLRRKRRTQYTAYEMKRR